MCKFFKWLHVCLVCRLEKSIHYVWWGLWLPHQIPSPGWLRSGKNQLPLPVHRWKVQLQIHHYSRDRFQRKKSGKFKLCYFTVLSVVIALKIDIVVLNQKHFEWLNIPALFGFQTINVRNCLLAHFVCFHTTNFITCGWDWYSNARLSLTNQIRLKWSCFSEHEFLYFPVTFWNPMHLIIYGAAKDGAD